MKTGTPTRRYELIALGVVGIFFTYFMPQIAVEPLLYKAARRLAVGKFINLQTSNKV